MRHNEYTPETFRMHFLTSAFVLSQKSLLTRVKTDFAGASKRCFATFRMHGLAILRHFVCKGSVFCDISYARLRHIEYMVRHFVCKSETFRMQM